MALAPINLMFRAFADRTRLRILHLLSREGEIAIAKRIEAGRNTMIAGLCESPLTFQAIIIWRDELLNEEILLRDVIDLEATFGRSLDGEEDLDGPPLDEVDVEAAPRRPAGAEPELDADGNPIVREMDEDEDDEASNMSLAAMENALKPRVLETLDLIARDYDKLADMQQLRMDATLSSSQRFSTPDEALAGIDRVNSDYPRHARRAVEIAREHFDANRVLSRLLEEACS